MNPNSHSVDDLLAKYGFSRLNWEADPALMADLIMALDDKSSSQRKERYDELWLTATTPALWKRSQDGILGVMVDPLTLQKILLPHRQPESDGPADSVECIFCKGRGWMEKRKPSTIIDSEPAQAHNYAPPGKLWQCGACGKITRDQYGEEGGWDESCMLNSFLIDEPRPAATEDSAK